MITIPVVTERCAGIDVGKRGLAVATATGPANKEAEIKTRWYGTTVPELREMEAWLGEQGCTSVAMESTGSYWIPVKNILEDSMKIMLVCSKKHQPKKGDKTDFRDAINLVHQHRHGLLTGSFLPERGIVELRDLTRRRKKLLGNIRAEKNRIQKVLETANVKIGNVVSDVFGVSGQEMLGALLSGKAIGAEEIAGMAKKRLRLKLPELTEALRDHQMNEQHRWLIEQSIEHSRMLDQQIEAVEMRIQQKVQPYQRQYELLMTIPGVKEHTAAAILAEIGADMKQFESADHLCSWGGICPGNNRSAGKSKSSHIKKANKFLLTALVESAWSAARKRGSMFERKAGRWRQKLGKKKATIAVCRSLLRVAYTMLRDDVPYKEPDAAVQQARTREHQIRHHARQLRRMGGELELVDGIVKQMLEGATKDAADATAHDPVAATAPTPDPAVEIQPQGRRRIARGVLGFRIRTAVTQCSNVKDLAGNCSSLHPVCKTHKSRKKPKTEPPNGT